MPQLNGAMLNDKMAAIADSGADRIITGDCGCLAQINGRLSRNNYPPCVSHIADLLAESLA